MIRAFIASTIAALLIVGCTNDPDALTGGPDHANDNLGANGGGAPSAQGEGTPGNGDPSQPGSCKEGTPHPGFAQMDFVGDRKPGAIGADRRRVKPFSALRTEFQRMLGAVPGPMAQSAAAFGDTPARWYSEPTAGAVSLNTTYSLAFTGCYEMMTDAKYGQAPTADTATTECASLQRKAWQRTPTPEETTACSELVVGLTTETVARRRWAHACASVMTAAGFTTY